MKKIEMLFYKTEPSAKNAGMKYVLFEIVTNESEIIHDWGFAEWDGLQWVPVDMPEGTPEGYSCKVKWWSNTVSPDLLIKEESKIIKI